eukprot:1682556-Amphidinium_carterae.1
MQSMLSAAWKVSQPVIDLDLANQRKHHRWRKPNRFFTSAPSALEVRAIPPLEHKFQAIRGNTCGE